MTVENQNQVDEMEIESGNNDDLGLEDDTEGGWKIADDIIIPPPPMIFGEIDTKGPRLMIVKIVANNFKSYAGKIEIGPFHKCFSAIVGPNGNGKSNAIDSMLFVFGYRANKIRTKKIVELIHNSKEFPDCNSCSVSVHFHQIIDKPDGGYDVVENSEFVISRTAFKDSSAYYEINGKRVQFKEIAKLLRSHYVDLDHNRFLILQGEVEQIALMKPKAQADGDIGMLEFLEDIIGTTRYKEPLTKLFERVEALTEAREEKLRRLKVVEKAKGELEIPMQEAVHYLKLENSIVKWQYKYYQCKKFETAQHLAEEEEKKKEVDKDHAELVAEMKTLQNTKEEKTKEFKEKSKKWDKIQQQKDSLTSEFNELRKKDESLYAESVATNKRRKDNMGTVKTEKTKLEDLQRIPEKNAKDIQECEQLSEKLTAELKKEEDNLTVLMSGLNEKIEPLSNKRKSLEKELVTYKKNVDQAKSAYELIKSKLELYTSEEQSEKNKLIEIKENLKTSAEKLQERKKQLASIEQKIPLTEKNLNKAHQELQALMEEEHRVNAELKSKRIKFDEQKSLMQASKSRNRILDSLMREKREGRIPGILGRLGDLGAIEAKYDVAVSTACGPLDNIVVDTVNTAQHCIDFLRQNNIGRGTFIALEKQQHLVPLCRQRIQTPENVHRLFDLITVENEDVLPAFYYGLRNTLVANDIDQATRIAYGSQRHRVVTLKGELIETSGTMSGGGRHVARGRMGQRVVRSEPSTEDIERLQQSLDEIFGRLESLRARQTPLNNQIQALTTGLSDMKVDQEKFALEIRSLSQSEPILKRKLKEQEEKVKNTVCDEKKVEDMENEIKKAKENLNKVENDAKTIETQVAKINLEIEEISGGKVKELQKKIAGVKKSLDKTKGEICRLEVAIKTSQRNQKKCEQRIETLENEIKECEEKIRTIQKDKVVCTDQAKAIMDQLQELNTQLEERDEQSKELKAEVDALQLQESKLKATKIDLDQKISQRNKVLKELQQRIPDLQRSLKNLKLQDIPNEESEELKELTEEELKELDSKTVAASLQKAKDKLPREIPNMQIIEQYREQNEIYLKRSEKLQKVTEERNKMRELYTAATRKRMQEFNAGFNMITTKLKEMYRMITLGGDAELELVDSLDPFSEGIVFSVRPPKKSWKYIQNLSGGEKTLSSLALVFALHHYKPTPVYFMDEIDAALDFKNVSIVASYIKERTKNAQFIVVSHRSDMFELADYLVGIYKIYNCSKCASIAVKKFNNKVGIEEPRPQQLNKHNFLTQPPSNVTALRETIADSRFDAIRPQRTNFPATCPENIAARESGDDLPANQHTPEENQENEDQTNTSLNLGDISLPCTPQKTPMPISIHPTKRRKVDETVCEETDESVAISPEKSTPAVESGNNVQKTLRTEALQSISNLEETPSMSRSSAMRSLVDKSDIPITSTPAMSPRRSVRSRRKTDSNTDEDVQNSGASLRKRRKN